MPNGWSSARSSRSFATTAPKKRVGASLGCSAQSSERARKAVERRYQLLPYLYTAFEEASRTGMPVMRPLWLEHPNDPSTYAVDDVYLLGRELLVAPKLVAGAARRKLTFPAGDWYSSETLELVSGGLHEVAFAVGQGLKLFVRAGAIVPDAPVVQSTSVSPQGPLTLNVWPGAECSGSLYIDDGATFAFQSGKYRRLQLTCEQADDAISIQSSSTGDYAAWWKGLRFVVRGVPRAPRSVVDESGAKLVYVYDAVTKTLTATLPRNATDFRIVAAW